MHNAIEVPNWFKQRRAERLRREIALLENMDARLWRKIVICGTLTIAVLATAFFGIGFALHVNLGLTTAIACSVGLAAVLYFVGRHEYGLLWLFAGILISIVLAVIFEDIIDHSILDVGGPDDLRRKPDRKAERRRKIDRAIARRKVRLETLLKADLK